MGGARPGQLDYHALAGDADTTCPVHDPEDGVPAFLLYSAGEDGKDDGGVGTVFRPKKGKDLNKDWSWPVPTRPEAG